MGWGEPAGAPPATGTTGQIADAVAALAAVGIRQPNLALGAMAAAGVIERLAHEAVHNAIDRIPPASIDGAAVLQPESIHDLVRNHIADLLGEKRS